MPTLSTSTRRAYDSYMRDFEAWCEANGVSSMPATEESVRSYFVLRGRTVARSSMRGRLAAIRHAHEEAGHPDPTVHESWNAVRALVELSSATDLGRAVPSDLLRLLTEPARSVVDVRDRLVVLLIAGAGLSRPEVVSLQRADVIVVGGSVKVARSRDRTVVIESTADGVDPKAIVAAWLGMLPPGDGPLVRSVTNGGVIENRGLSIRSVNVALRRRAASVGLDPDSCTPEALRPIPLME